MTLQAIKMHSAGVAGGIKISPHFTFFPAEKKILESSSNPYKKSWPNSPHTNDLWDYLKDKGTHIKHLENIYHIVST